MDSELRKLQNIDINILNRVVDIFEDNKLMYYMIAGTMLGAVRHKGFIPWDDDMDIAMPRKDYEAFLKIADVTLPPYLRIQNFRVDKNYKYAITRVVDQRYKVKELRDHNDRDQANVSIDIFPIDGTPNNFLLRKIYFFRILSLRALISLIQKDNIDRARSRSIGEKAVIFVGTHLPLEKMFSAHKLQIKIDNILKKQSDSSEYAGTIMGAYRTREILPRRYFGKGRKYEFEGRMFNGPEDYDAYLKHMYGDYMKLPSEEERHQKRHFKLLNSDDEGVK